MDAKIAPRPLLGAELHRLPTPPLGEDLDIFRVSTVAGAADVPVADHQLVDLDNEMMLFSAPKHVLPGSRRLLATTSVGGD